MTPSQLMPVSWQLLQLPVTAEWILALLGAGLANPVVAPPEALAATRPDGTLPRWQASHAALFGAGMCELAPALWL